VAVRAVAAVRTVAALRAGWGVVLVCAPAGILAFAGHPEATTSTVVARVLGARHLAQAAVTFCVPTAAVVAGGAVVDVLHSLTGTALASASSRWRRVALADALIAAGFAATGSSVHRPYRSLIVSEGGAA
jgi:hypothetical protein